MMSSRRSEEGFTIIEGLVVLAVIAVVATLVLANLRFGQKKTILDNEALRLTQFIRRAKASALGSVTFQGGVPGGGYGVSVDSGQANNVAILFADQNGNQRFDGAYDRCNQECVERLVLSAGVILTNVQPAVPLDVTFLPPNVATAIRAGGGSGSQADKARITLSFSTDPTLQKTVVVTSAGEISIQ